MSKSRLLFLILALSLLFVGRVVIAVTTPDDTASQNPATDTTLNTTTTDTTSQTAGYQISPERRQEINAYSRVVNIWRFADFFISIAILLIILVTGLSAKMRTWAQVARKKFFVVWLYIAMLAVAWYILNFPFNLYRGFIVESQFGFMNQTFVQWLGDDLLNLAILIVIGIIPAWFFYWMVNRFKRWWLVFSIGAIPFMIFMIVIAPVVISPMFNKYEPLKDQQLKTELLQLADKAGIQGSHIYEVNGSKQSDKVNAYVTGLFGSKRIVLYDTLIKNFTPAEIKFVMAHEMGHYVMHHVWWGLLVAIVFLTFSLWLMNLTIRPTIRRFKRIFRFDHLGDIASLPLVLAFVTVISFVFQPVTNAASRAMERAADRYGLRMSGVSAQTAVNAFRKLASYNLSDPNPSPIIEFWFYTHPSLDQRIKSAERYERKLHASTGVNE